MEASQPHELDLSCAPAGEGEHEKDHEKLDGHEGGPDPFSHVTRKAGGYFYVVELANLATTGPRAALTSRGPGEVDAPCLPAPRRPLRSGPYR